MLRPYPLSARAKQIVSLLREHGPLSIGVIAQSVEPAMMKRKCREVVKGLRDKGLVRRFNSYLPECSGNFYALRKTRAEMSVIAKALGEDPAKFEICFVRGAEIKHGEQCALWSEYFKKHYPEAKVIRDWELHKHSDLKDAFMGSREDRDLLPDVVIFFKRSYDQEPLLLAVEIERTRKNSRRLVAKVRSLATQTQLDGVLYVCADFDIGESLRLAFSSSGIARSRRIGRYAKDFLLFSTFDALAGRIGPRYVNAGLQERSLELWIDTLRKNSVRSRTAEMFELPA